MTSRIEVDGVQRFRVALRRAGVSLDDLKDAHQKVAATVARAASDRAPRRTGRLAGRLRGNKAVRQAVVSAPGVRYGPPIHWGSPKKNIRPNPFITRAAEATESTWTGVYSDAIDAVLAKLEGTWQ